LGIAEIRHRYFACRWHAAGREPLYSAAVGISLQKIKQARRITRGNEIIYAASELIVIRPQYR
jgi:hypothetical protein